MLIAVLRGHRYLARARYPAMLVGLLIVTAVAASDAAASSTSWHDCGTVRQLPFGGYVATSRVQARDGVSCTVAHHIALHFRSGGYYYSGLTCFYAPMGSRSYWNWSCAKGTPGHKLGTRDKVRGHIVLAPARKAAAWT